MGVTVDHDDDLEGLRRVGRAVADARDAMLAAIAPGVTTGALDAVGRQVLRAHGARSAPQVAVGFPAATCVSVVANLNGHGVGAFLHEPPSVSSIEDPTDGTLLWEGLVLAIEPFLSTGANYAVEGGDGWALRTPDGSLAAQFEHTVVVTAGRPLVLTESAAA